MSDAMLETPTNGSVSGSDRAQLLDKVDELLERYLKLLDEYQNERNLLSKSLSSVSTPIL